MTDRPSRRGRLNEGRPRIGESRAKNRVFRIQDELYAAAVAEAKRRGMTLSEAVRALLERFVKKEI